MPSFDEKLWEIYKKHNPEETNVTKLYEDGSDELNKALRVAVRLLNVEWRSTVVKDHNLEKATTKLSVISNLRKSFRTMITQLNSLSNDEDTSLECSLMKDVMENFKEVHKQFSFVHTGDAFTLLLNCLCPNKIEPLGNGSEMFYTNSTFHKLLQLSALYGFKSNSKITNENTTSSFCKEVLAVLDGILKPDNFSGVEEKNNEGKSFYRVKFCQEDKVAPTKVHPDFLKIVALLRLFHSTLLKNMKPSFDNAEKINKIVTYGLLTEIESVRVIGIRAIVAENHTDYKYELLNVGTFLLEQEEQVDLLVSFLLEASRETISEEKEMIKTITTKSMGKPRLKSMGSAPKSMEGQKLLLEEERGTSSLTLNDYLVLQSSDTADLYRATFDHSSQRVVVKIFKEKLNRHFPPCNIFYNYGSVFFEDKPFPKEMEISLEGTELNVKTHRTFLEKIHIITQLLLEINQIHDSGCIHNDVKPANIIILEKDQMKLGANELPFYCKFIDFDISRMFNKEDGNKSSLFNRVIISKEGTSTYNAPEKQDNGDNCIHPKTDIYSLGLVFIELILEKKVIQITLTNLEFWPNFKKTCEQLIPEKGQVICEMIEKMVKKERKERLTAQQCLDLLGVQESVDKTDSSEYFVPPPSSSKIQESNIDSANLDDETESKKEFEPIILKSCCTCISGNCTKCKCSNHAFCANCKSTGCSKKRSANGKSSPTKKKKLNK